MEDSLYLIPRSVLTLVEVGGGGRETIIKGFSMKIPITKNLSTDIQDSVGALDVPDDMAEYMAECYTHNLKFEVNACVEIQDDKPVLKHVSLSAVPVKTTI